jgi:hypothetical protein
MPSLACAIDCAIGKTMIGCWDAIDYLCCVHAATTGRKRCITLEFGGCFSALIQNTPND